MVKRSENTHQGRFGFWHGSATELHHLVLLPRRSSLLVTSDLSGIMVETNLKRKKEGFYEEIRKKSGLSALVRSLAQRRRLHSLQSPVLLILWLVVSARVLGSQLKRGIYTSLHLILVVRSD